LFGDADIVISKIDPYLAYVFINDITKNYIGTTELLPFKLISNDIDVHYLKYLLLSHDYVQKSSLLMYGKRHPRIHHKDLLAMQIPVPNETIQSDIVNDIKDRERNRNMLLTEISRLRTKIGDIIIKSIK